MQSGDCLVLLPGHFPGLGFGIGFRFRHGRIPHFDDTLDGIECDDDRFRTEFGPWHVKTKFVNVPADESYR